jgi:hypothetical protein
MEKIEFEQQLEQEEEEQRNAAVLEQPSSHDITH